MAQEVAYAATRLALSPTHTLYSLPVSLSLSLSLYTHTHNGKQQERNQTRERASANLGCSEPIAVVLNDHRVRAVEAHGPLAQVVDVRRRLPAAVAQYRASCRACVAAYASSVPRTCVVSYASASYIIR
eukprot:1450818-Rhodomonas_salina.1